MIPAEVEVKLDHMACGPCVAEGLDVTLCGTSLDNIEFVDQGTPHQHQPCIVCFSGPTVICNNCKEEIECR